MDRHDNKVSSNRLQITIIINKLYERVYILTLTSVAKIVMSISR